ncbi:COBW domain-containing protein 1 isoform X1 [Iris pallida]|uniref:COBW domain-containing protein 1 isoform X1 n=1 Tax=Iris pallida TaxID=29817 RepID=A0AAX6E9F3_IRIPA|nr:COBW domain-containing protein 1 isoform X1 [Iris pallida]
MALTSWLAAGGQLLASRFEQHDVRSLLPVESEVLDTKNIRMMLKEQCDSASFSKAFLQIAFADVVILNKVDLILQEEPRYVHLEELEKEIHNINSLATVIQSVRC